MEKLQILSVNVRGLNSDEKRQKLYEWLKLSQCDVILLQETHFIEKNELKYNTGWYGKIFHSFSDSSHSKGVSVLFRKNLNVEILNVKKSIDGRKILLNVEFDSEIFTIVNIYAPNDINKRIDFFKRVYTFITKNCLNENIIVCGDFNCRFNDKQDKSKNYLINLLKQLDLVDVWDREHPDLKGDTWCNAQDIPFSRIDYIFMSNNFCFQVGNIIVKKLPGTHSRGTRMSDHRYLKMYFNISKNSKGPNYWKLNISYLENKEYKDSIANLVDEVDHVHNPIDKWELFKRKVKEFSILYAKNKRKNMREKIILIEKEIETIESSQYNNIDYGKLKTLYTTLNELYDKKN